MKGTFRGTILETLADIPFSFKLTSGFIKRNKKKNNRGRKRTIAQGYGKQGRRAHDGTMDGPYRTSRLRGG